jgi:hypothetical protein
MTLLKPNSFVTDVQQVRILLGQQGLLLALQADHSLLVWLLPLWPGVIRILPMALRSHRVLQVGHTPW